MSDILPIFTSHYSYLTSILTLEEAGKTKPGNPVSICDIAKRDGLKQVVVVDERIDGFLEAYKNLTKLKHTPVPPRPLSDYIAQYANWVPEAGAPDLALDEIEGIRLAKASGAHLDDTKRYQQDLTRHTVDTQLIYGIKLCVCADETIKDDASLKTESNVIIFIRNTAGYSDLIKIYNRAWTDGFYYKGRTSWRTLRAFWTPNLTLALPTYSSFIYRNAMTFSSIVPDLPCVPTIFREIDSRLPFEGIVNDAIDAYAQSVGAQTQRTKSIYYDDGARDFDAYVTFRAIGNRSEFARPNVDHLCSDRFSYSAYRELVAPTS